MAVLDLALLEEPEQRKARGAFFTPPAIASFLARWAISGNPSARVLDPTSGEGAFLIAAARQLRELGVGADQIESQVLGIDLHHDSILETRRLLHSEGFRARILGADFFAVAPPMDLFATIEPVDAVVGNPPFVRYQQHTGDARRLSAQAALRQGVRLSGLASSWASALVHAGAFLKPDGRLAMVLPAELLTVQYAEPIRRWLRARFASVTLVLFETLQFADALEHVVLVLAHGSGGTDDFALCRVHHADELQAIILDEVAYSPADRGKWSDLLLSTRQRDLFTDVVRDHFVDLKRFGSPELGTVTGANAFFAVNESKRKEFELTAKQLMPISPPGTRHLRGLRFTPDHWDELREADEAVWLLYPDPADRSRGLERYLATGRASGVDQAYKCRVRTPWWRPPMVSPPDLFFTYMSHRYPRLVTNNAGVSFLNSMHGVRLGPEAPLAARDALPLLALNSVTMLGAEVFGRSYGGGVLKMEPREASCLPVPKPDHLCAAWQSLHRVEGTLDAALQAGDWERVVLRIDDVLLRRVMKVPMSEVEELRAAAAALRARRLMRSA